MNHPHLVHHLLEHSAERLPDKEFIVCGDQRLTYTEVNEKADRLAAGLVDLGVNRQDRVAIFLDNSGESVIALYGALKAGAIFIMLGATMKARKLRYILNDSGARVLITQSQKGRIVEEAAKNAPDLQHIIWCDSDPTQSSNKRINPSTHQPVDISWTDFISKPPGLPASLLPADVVDLDLATIIYTSGSTGEPKGVMSAHSNVMAAVRSITSYLENVEDDIVLSALPLSFDYGLYQVLMAALFGGTVILEKSFVFPYRVLERLVQERATGFPLVPTMAAMILRMEDLSQFDLTSLRYITNTAAALPTSHIRELRNRFPQAAIYSMYGLTECKRVSYLPPEEIDRRPGSVGLPMPNVEIFIVDEDGSEVGPEATGELVVRGASVMQGYWNDPEATARVYRPGRHPGERLLYSGDLFKRDNAGFLYFVGRKDDMIKTKGERVSPKEIENCLCEIDGVVEAAVIGVPDEVLGQAVKAFLTTNGRNVTGRQVLMHCQRHLEPFMIPKYLVFVDSFKKTNNGKIDKEGLHSEKN